MSQMGSSWLLGKESLSRRGSLGGGFGIRRLLRFSLTRRASDSDSMIYMGSVHMHVDERRCCFLLFASRLY